MDERAPATADRRITNWTVSHGVNKHLTRGTLISRADVADYMLTDLDDQAMYRAQVETAY